jgi:hypothetical protein
MFNDILGESLVSILWEYTLIRTIMYIFTYINTGIVLRVLGYRSGGLGSIPDTTRKKK